MAKKYVFVKVMPKGQWNNHIWMMKMNFSLICKLAWFIFGSMAIFGYEMELCFGSDFDYGGVDLMEICIIYVFSTQYIRSEWIRGNFNICIEEMMTSNLNIFAWKIVNNIEIQQNIDENTYSWIWLTNSILWPVLKISLLRY